MRCANGHDNPTGQAFCGTCGQPLNDPVTDVEDPAPNDPDLNPDAPGPAVTAGPGAGAVSSPPTAPPPPPPPPDAEITGTGPAKPGGSKTKVIAAGSVVALLVVVAVLALSAGGADKQPMRGTFTLFDEDFDIDGDFDDCEGTGGYSDFSAGRDVTVRDGDGKIVGAGTLRNVADRDELVDFLVASDEADDADDSVIDFVVDNPAAVCILVAEFDVDQAEFYEIKVGQRGELSYRAAELADNDWMFNLTLGN